MDERLQEAIGAARAGETRTAQHLLTEVLKEDPNQVHAWFLLSYLVESRQKQQAYLSRVLALDPQHELARQRLALLRSDEAGGAIAPTAPTMPQPVVTAAAELDVLAQAEGDTLPDWLAEDAALVQVAETAVAPTPVAESAPEPLPDWLQAGVSHEFLGIQPEEETPTPAPAAASKTAVAVKPQPAATPAQDAARQAAVRRWNIILAILAMLALITLVLFINALRGI